MVYDMYTYSCHKNQPSIVGKYSIHGFYGMENGGTVKLGIFMFREFRGTVPKPASCGRGETVFLSTKMLEKLGRLREESCCNL